MFKQPSDHSKATLGKIAQDFFKIEINTIIKDGMSAEPVPALPLALFDIAESYNTWLAGRLQKAMPGFDLPAPQSAGPATFSNLSMAVPLLIGSGTLAEAELAIAYRIKHNSEKIVAILSNIFQVDQAEAPVTEADVPKPLRLLSFIKKSITRMTPQVDGAEKVAIWVNLFERDKESLCEFVHKNSDLVDHQLQKLGFSPADVSLVAKIWDIGTEIIVMQSVVYISGDIVTRVSGTFASDQYATLHQTHFRSVGAAVDAWNRLTELLVKVGGALVGLATGRG
jgi:hypothetical protein